LGLLNAALFLILVALLFTAYLVTTTRVFRDSPHNNSQTTGVMKYILLFTGIFLTVSFFVPGTFSSDLHSYIWYGKIYALFADNPLLAVPSYYAWYDTQGWLQWVYWKDVPSAYGPAWLLLAGGIAQVARAIDNDIVTHLMGHKLLASTAHLLNVWLVWHLGGYVVRRYWRRNGNILDQSRVTQAQLGVTLLYAWNPLLLVEFGVSGHNDVLMLTFIFSALLLYFRGHPLVASVLFASACMIKAIALIFLPGYLWLLLWHGPAPPAYGYTKETSWRFIDRLALVAKAMVLVLSTWLAFYLPFWAGSRTLEAVSGGPAARYFIHSLGAVLRFRLPEGTASVAAHFGLQPPGSWTVDEIGRRLEWPARWGPLIITYAVFVFQTLYARSFPRMVVAWCWVLFTFLTVGAGWFWPWYVSWLIGPAILIGPGRILNAAHILAFSSLSLYAIHPIVARPFDKLPDWSGLWVAGPPLIFVAVSYLFDRWKK
jgi:hypothetical protein